MSTSAIAGRSLPRSWEALGDDGYYAFNDVHALMAFLATGNQRQVKRILEGLEAGVAPRRYQRHDEPRCGLPMARALCAFERQDYEIAIDELQRIRGFAQRFGGSHAQRDLLQLTATEAALRAGGAHWRVRWSASGWRSSRAANSTAACWSACWCSGETRTRALLRERPRLPDGHDHQHRGGRRAERQRRHEHAPRRQQQPATPDPRGATAGNTSRWRA